MVVWEVPRDDARNLWRINADGGELFQLTDVPHAQRPAARRILSGWRFSSTGSAVFARAEGRWSSSWR